MNLSRPLALLKQLSGSIMSFVVAHKVWTGVIAMAVLGGGYWGYQTLSASSGGTSYVVQAATKGSITVAVTGSGQVSASRKIALTPKTSGEVMYVGVKAGDTVRAGQTIASLDSADAAQSLRDAQLSLETAELTYEKSTASSTALELLQAQNAVTNAQTSLLKAHDSSYASLAGIYTDLSTVVSGLDAALHDSNVSGRANQQNIDAYADLVGNYDATIPIYKNSTATSYTAAVTAYNNALVAYKATSRSASNDDLIALAQKTYEAAQTVADAVKNAHDFFDRVNTDYTLYNLGSSSALTTLISSINTYTTTTNNDLSTALSTKTSIVSAEQTLAEAEDTLSTTQTGPDELDLKSAALTLKKAQEAVDTAQQNLNDYYVTAPFAGTIASVGVETYDQASSGTTIATLITTDEYAELSLNEVDAAKVKVGNPVSLTFDAVEGLALKGTVAEVDSLGTVSSGVVSYSIKIGFDTQDARVKPGMTVTAVITTDSKDNVIVIPSSALKSSGGSYYVEVAAGTGLTTGTSTARTAFPGRFGSSTPESFASSTRSASTTPFTATSTAARTGTHSFSRTINASDVTLTRVPVEIGLQSDTEVEITSGLTLGEEVVTQTVSGTTAAASSGSGGLFGLFGGGARATTRTTSGTGTARVTGSAGSANATFRSEETPPGGF